MGQWRVLIAETITGNLLAEVTPRDLPSFSRKVGDKGSWTVNVLPEDRNNAHLDMHTFTEAGRFSWVIAYDEVIVQAGPVWTFQYDDSTRNLAVTGTGLQGIFDRRAVRNAAGNPATVADASNDLVLTNLTLRGIGDAIVGANLAQAGYGLPIDRDSAAQGEVGTNQRTYQGYDLAYVWDRLTELSNVANGPEFDFKPVFDAPNSRVRWQMRLGNPKVGTQAADARNRMTWDYGGALTQIVVDVNGSAACCTRAWVKGTGTERTLLTGYATDATLIALGYPPTDYVDNDHTSATEVATLNAWASGDLTKFSAASETWRCVIRVEGLIANRAVVAPQIAALNDDLGALVNIGVTGHPWITKGTYTHRALGYSNQDASTVNVEMESTPEVT